MFPSGIDIAVSQHIRNQVDIAGLLVQGGAIGTAQLVGRNFLKSSNPGCIFFYKVFHGTHRHAPILQGEEEGVFMSLRREHMFPLFQIIQQGRPHLFTEIDDRLLTSLAQDSDPVHIKVYILDIQSHTLRHSDSCPQ